MSYSKWLNFFNRTVSSVTKKLTREEFHQHNLMTNNAFLKAIPSSLVTATQNSVRVFYNQRYFKDPLATTPYSINRLINNTAAVSVAGDRDGYFQDGTPFTDKNFFAQLKPGDSRGLAPEERLLSPKKMITSISHVFAAGGYPAHNPRELVSNSFPVGIISWPGCQFENTYLQYRLFFMDRFSQNLNNPHFTHLYTNSPTNFEQAYRELDSQDPGWQLKRPRIDLLFIARNEESGKFYTSLFKKNAIIFHAQAYMNSLKEDVILALCAANKMAEEDGRPAFLKATGVGMGHFSKIDCSYPIHGYLQPLYLKAYKNVLEEYRFPHIAAIEFPLFDEADQALFDEEFADTQIINRIQLSKSMRDALAFNETEKKKFCLLVLNPSDSNAYPGNEPEDASLEACIGNNSTLRIDQIPWNPRFNERSIYVGVSIKDKEEYQYLVDEPNILKRTP